MEELDRLLERFSETKRRSEQYSVEVDSLRAEIEGTLERLGQDSYQNNDWKIIRVNEKEQSSIKIKKFLLAMDEANLDENQRQILENAISKIDHLAHIRILKVQ